MPDGPTTSRTAPALEKALRAARVGDVRFDDLSRTLYSTDASLYEIVPVGVVLPKNVRDVVAVVRTCHRFDASIVARGAGTGLTGGAVGPGVQLDLSRYMNRIGRIDLERRTVEVEPGVVLDELNAELAPHGLHFAPDVATGSRATIGGMIANNSCGAHSVVYGRTVDHVLELSVVLADGTLVTFRDTGDGADDRATFIERELARIRDQHYEEIKRRFPKILRSNGGYGLDRLGPPGKAAKAVKVLCGSEGTLGIVVGARLKLTPIPKHTGLVVLHFEHVLDALGATPSVLEHGPAAVELVDRMILDAAFRQPTVRSRCDFVRSNPAALLIVEFHGNDAETVSSKARALAEAVKATDARRRRAGCEAASLLPTASIVLEPQRQADVWNLRKAGLGLLMSKPGDAQPHAFVEDSAVDPSRLREYIERISDILRREGSGGSAVVEAGYYAHASVGCIHVRPVLNLKRADDIHRMRRIAEAVCDLALEFGGAMTGEHGDGIVRSCWIERMYGPEITGAFRQVKQLFDPDNRLNPHKIVDPWPMTEHLRFGPSLSVTTMKTHLDFAEYGGPAGLAGMCSGVGQCRQRLVGTMCPSYMATHDETHTTRARANALRVALSNHGLLDGFDDPRLAEVMDLCISCKACKTQCPTGVDMARLKAEYLSHRNLNSGVSRRARFLADVPHRLAMAGRFAFLSNLVGQSRPFRAWIERRFGLDRRLAPPRLARQTFHAWFRQHRKRSHKGRVPAVYGLLNRGLSQSRVGTAHPTAAPARIDAGQWRDGIRTFAQAESCGSGRRPGWRGPVIYWVDTWTNYCTPEVGVAAVTLLERAGFEVRCPSLFCCGRPAISQGLLAEARKLAELNVGRLARIARDGVPIVGTEPSCIFTLVDEYPQLVRGYAVKRLAGQAMMLETCLERLLCEDPTALPFVTSDVAAAHALSVQGRTEDEALSAPPLWTPPESKLEPEDAHRSPRLLYHAHCHQKALVGTADAVALLRRVFGEAASEINSGCCGMAGSFGHEIEHYDVARAIGEQRLFPTVRQRGDAAIAVSGFSCRQQIEHHTGVRPRHVAEYLADALLPPSVQVEPWI